MQPYNRYRKLLREDGDPPIKFVLTTINSYHFVRRDGSLPRTRHARPPRPRSSPSRAPVPSSSPPPPQPRPVHCGTDVGARFGAGGMRGTRGGNGAGPHFPGGRVERSAVSTGSAPVLLSPPP